MKRKYKKAEVTDTKYIELASYCNKNNLYIDVDSEYYYLLELYETVEDGKVISNKDEYNKEMDKQIAIMEIQQLKDELNADGYKIEKCYEYALVGLDIPYDIQELHKIRQARRDKINELERSLI